ncbi:hypothetical protein [Promicromonospora sp. NPDC090134]|uniref:hypothetical protein n=1 Tax=Promicromonospora sp. NPDC090134 TaxID=3364408 RepID=UPI00381F7ED0
MTEEASESDGSTERRIRVQRPGGQWEDLPPTSPLSDAPAVNAIGKRSLRELAEILKDENDPDYANALKYDQLLRSRMQPGVESYLAKVTKAGRAATTAGSLGRRYRELATATLPTFPASSLVDLPSFRFAWRQTEPTDVQPAAADVVEIPDWREALLSLQRDQIELLQNGYDADRADAADAKVAADEARATDRATAARTARREWIGIAVAGFLGLAGLVMSIVAIRGA